MEKQETLPERIFGQEAIMHQQSDMNWKKLKSIFANKQKNKI